MYSSVISNATSAFNYQKLTGNFKETDHLFIYQSDPHDERWIVKFSRANTTEQLLTALKSIQLCSNHDHPVISSIRNYYVQNAHPTGFEIYEKLPRMKENLSDVLTRHINQQKPMSEAQIIKYFYSIVSGIEYLHNKKIPHRNIKPTNILFNRFGDIKLADIRAGNIIRELDTFGVPINGEGSIYIAPEIQALNMEQKLKKEQLYRGDMWSLGAIIVELCLNERLAGDAKIQNRVAELKVRYNEVLVEILSSLMRENPEERMTVGNVKANLMKIYGELQNEKPLLEGVERAKKECAEKYARVFEFEPNKQFSIKSIDGSWIYDDLIKHLMTDLDEKLKGDGERNLENFEFSVDACPNITANGIKYLTRYIGTNLRNLRDLSLAFTYCENFGANEIHELCLIGPNLKQLEYLSLKFQRCKEITDKAVQELVKHIANTFGTLKHLILDFRNCNKLTSAALQDLSKSFRGQLPKLLTLNLKFSSCDLIDDKGLVHLHGLIGPDFPKLEGLSLAFANCPKVASSKAVKTLCSGLRAQNRAFKYLRLDFVACKILAEKFTIKDIEKLKGELSYVKKLELCFV